MKLREWAIKNDISPQTAYHWFRNGTLPVRAERDGPKTIMVFEEAKEESGRTVLYARSSSSKDAVSLESQKSRLLEWAVENKIVIDSIVTEFGSGLNDKRKKWNSLLSDPTATTIIVEHRDRACRFGFEQLQAALKAQNRSIRVVDSEEVEDDLVRDVTEVLTSLCARLYGKRGAAAKARKSIKVALDC